MSAYAASENFSRDYRADLPKSSPGLFSLTVASRADTRQKIFEKLGATVRPSGQRRQLQDRGNQASAYVFAFAVTRRDQQAWPHDIGSARGKAADQVSVLRLDRRLLLHL